MPDLRYLAPAGLTRLWDYERRFRALGLPARWARKRAYRKAIDVSVIEMLPADRRRDLKSVVDVGANVGDWSIGIALLTDATEITAFEPVPDTFVQLCRNCAPFAHIRCVQSALGAKVGETEMNVHRLHAMSSVLRIRDDVRRIHGMEEDIAIALQVPLTTLDESLSGCEEISLLKLDVQGYEPQVLAGGCAVMQRTQSLIVEVTYSSYYEGDMQFADLHQLITSTAPFELWGISAPHCAPSGKPMWADAVYVRRDRPI